MIDRIYNFLWEWRIINHPFWYDFIDIYPVEHLFIHAVNDFFSTTEITSFKEFFSFFAPRQTTKGGVISIYISYLKMTTKTHNNLLSTGSPNNSSQCCVQDIQSQHDINKGILVVNQSLFNYVYGVSMSFLCFTFQEIN